MSEEHIVSEEEARMSFTEHLGELRVRLIRSAIAVVVGALICYIFSKDIYRALAQPLGVDSTWVTLNPLEYIIFSLKVGGYGGIVLAMPVIIHQLCSFVFPGLRPKEKRAAQVLLIGGFLLAFAGTMVAYFGVLPFLMPYLTSFVPNDIEQQLRVGETIAIIVKILVGFGIAFQFPMVVLILVHLGILSPETLKQYRKVTVVGLAVGSAMLTPPDPISMGIMLLPLYALFEGSIWMSYLVVRRQKSNLDNEGE